MKEISTKKHLHVRVEIYSETIKAGIVILTCIDCKHTLIGGYGKSDPNQKDEQALKFELDSLECNITLFVGKKGSEIDEKTLSVARS